MPQTQFTEFSENFGIDRRRDQKIRRARRAVEAPKPATKAIIRATNVQTKVPVSKIGAYVVVARADDGSAVRANRDDFRSGAAEESPIKTARFVFVADAQIGRRECAAPMWF